jgi:hypothetical protein
METTTMTPNLLAQMPTIEDIPCGAYEWRKQRRTGHSIEAAIANKQTFSPQGQPQDSTMSTGNTRQTFSPQGKPHDSASD